MSSADFIKQIVEEGRKHSGSGGGGVISQITIEFGYHRYVTGHDFWSFWKPIGNPGDAKHVSEELAARLQKAGCADKPAFGIKITIDKNVLGRNKPYRDHLREFIPEWQEDSFDMLISHIENLPIGKQFWGRVEYKANPYFVKQGEAGKKETDQNGNPRYPSIRVPIESYTSEQAARQVAGDDGSSSASDDSQWSEIARSNYSDTATLVGQAQEISEWYAKMIGSTPFNNDPENFPLPKPLTPPAVKQQLAQLYQVEPADIDILMSMDIAF